MPLRGWGERAATIPSVRAKWHYSSGKGWSKLGRMHDHATDQGSERPGRLTEASRDQPTRQQLSEASRETRRPGRRYTVKEAAKALGTTVDAVRGRIRRGTLDNVKLDGVVYVLLDATDRERQREQLETDPGGVRQPNADQSELVGELRDQIDWLRREVERKDTIIMSLTQSVPELEAPVEPRDTSATASPRSDEGTAPEHSQEQTERRSWWRRFFGFE